jgi:preprotein translocase subunit SecB
MNNSNDIDSESESPFYIHRQYIKDLSFENPNPLFQAEEQPAVSVDVQIGVSKVVDETFEVVVDLQVSTKVKDESLFLLELSYGTVVTIAKHVQSENFSEILMVAIPTIIFPYLRSIVSNTIADGGFPPLYLDPIDFAAMYVQHAAVADGDVAGHA